MSHVTGGAGWAREKDLGKSGGERLVDHRLGRFHWIWLRMPPKTPIWKSIGRSRYRPWWLPWDPKKKEKKGGEGGEGGGWIEVEREERGGQKKGGGK